jgi:hypothetical protein
MKKGKRRNCKILNQTIMNHGQTTLTNFFSINITNESHVTGSESTCSAASVLKIQDDGSNTVADNNENDITELTPLRFSNVDSQALSEETSEMPSDERNEVEGWYKNNKIDLKWLLEAHNCLSASRDKFGDRTRPSVTCLVCATHEEHVKRFSSNGQVPLARGVCADGKDRLVAIIDHLGSAMHIEAERLQKHEKNWAQMSDSHPLVRIFNKANADTRNVVVHLAIDVYNDSLVETLSARSWPSRSLSCEYANYILDKFDKNGWDTADISFNITSSMCHYRSPIIYAEMLEVIGDLVRREVCKKPYKIAFVILCKLMAAWIGSSRIQSL